MLTICLICYKQTRLLFNLQFIVWPGGHCNFEEIGKGHEDNV